jgi:phosphoesterase RecJ-like protein
MTINLNTKEVNKFVLAFKKIEQANNILLITHQRPDGDAVSSICAMIDYVESINKNYLAFCTDSASECHQHLPNIEKINSDIENLDLFKYDLIIILDSGNLDRTGLANKITILQKENKSSFIIEFDHHPKQDNYSNLEIRDDKAASTTEVLYYFLKINKIRITKNIANCILSGIIDDTDSFLHPNTTEKTVNIASEMLMWGAQLPRITKNKWFNKSLGSMKLWGIALSNLQINKKYNLAFSILTKKHTEGITDDDDIYTSIANYFSSLYGVSGVLFLREEKDNKIKASLRSAHPKADMTKIARLFDGGGHAKASGFVIDGKIEKNNNKWIVI